MENFLVPDVDDNLIARLEEKARRSDTTLEELVRCILPDAATKVCITNCEEGKERGDPR